MLPTFELPSAKNMSVDTAVKAFVPTELYWKTLFADTNDIIFGTRGSGKTMLLRMMSFSHLASFAKVNERARMALFDSRRIGMFIPLGIDWCVAYQDDSPGTFELFVTGINLVSADCLIDTLDHILQSDIISVIDRREVERKIIENLGSLWFRNEQEKNISIFEMRATLLRHQAVLRDVWRGKIDPPSTEEFTSAGFHFRASPLLRPLIDAISILNQYLGLPTSHRWIVCLDELEDLKPRQAQSIMTLLRGVTDKLTLKITTQPYTLESSDTAFSNLASAVDFRDFEVRRLQYDPAEKEYKQLALDILRKRVKSDPHFSSEKIAEKLFGNSTFSERAAESSSDFSVARNRLMQKGFNADSLRKKVPVLAIRYLRKSIEGHENSIAYSGWETVVRASDGNPGMLVRILNAFAIDPFSAEEIPKTKQHKVLSGLASAWMEWSSALYSNGAHLYNLIRYLGQILHRQIHERALLNDDVPFEANRFLVNLAEIDPITSEAFKVGARHSLFVAETLDGSLRYPNGRGVWRLSYALAPQFWLLLRRGRIMKIATNQQVMDLGVNTRIDDLIFEPGFVAVEQMELSTKAEDAEL